jgi:hypothetical protein
MVSLKYELPVLSFYDFDRSRVAEPISHIIPLKFIISHISCKSLNIILVHAVLNRAIWSISGNIGNATISYPRYPTTTTGSSTLSPSRKVENVPCDGADVPRADPCQNHTVRNDCRPRNDRRCASHGSHTCRRRKQSTQTTAAPNAQTQPNLGEGLPCSDQRTGQAAKLEGQRTSPLIGYSLQARFYCRQNRQDVVVVLSDLMEHPQQEIVEDILTLLAAGVPVIDRIVQHIDVGIQGLGLIDAAWVGILGQEPPCCRIIVPRPQEDQPHSNVLLLTRETVPAGGITLAPQQAAEGRVSLRQCHPSASLKADVPIAIRQLPRRTQTVVQVSGPDKGEHAVVQQITLSSQVYVTLPMLSIPRLCAAGRLAAP